MLSCINWSFESFKDADRGLSECIGYFILLLSKVMLNLRDLSHHFWTNMEFPMFLIDVHPYTSLKIWNFVTEHVHTQTSISSMSRTFPVLSATICLIFSL